MRRQFDLALGWVAGWAIAIMALLLSGCATSPGPVNPGPAAPATASTSRHSLDDDIAALWATGEDYSCGVDTSATAADLGTRLALEHPELGGVDAVLAAQSWMRRDCPN